MKKIGYKQYRANHDGGSSRLDSVTLKADFRDDGCVHDTLTLAHSNYAGFSVTCEYDLDNAEDRSVLRLRTADSEDPDEDVVALFREFREGLGGRDDIPGLDLHTTRHITQ